MAAKKSMKLGGGGRFKKGVAAIQKKEGLSKKAAGAIMAKAGAKKYGAAKMVAMSAKGRKRHAGSKAGKHLSE